MIYSQCFKLLITSFCLVLISQTALAAEVVSYRHDKSWPSELNQFNWGVVEEGGLKSAAGIAVDRTKGLVYTLVREKPYVRVFREDGAFVRSWSPEKVSNVHMIHVDPSGDIWIADNHVHTVTKYSPTGKVLLTLGTYNEPGMDDKHFNGPTDIATTADGKYIFISDGYENNRIAKFNSSGKYLGMWGGADPGTKHGQFILPHSIAVMGDRVYVADRSGGRIQVFDLDGNFLDEWKGIISPWGIAGYNNHIYVAGQKFGKGPYPTAESLIEYVLETGAYTPAPVGQDLMVFDTKGSIVTHQSLPQGREFGEVDWVHGIDIGAEGDIYLADVTGNHIQKWKKLLTNVSSSPHAEKNYPASVYWGDTHLHTNLSTDAYASGTRLDSEIAYRYASGEVVTTSQGKSVQ